ADDGSCHDCEAYNRACPSGRSRNGRECAMECQGRSGTAHIIDISRAMDFPLMTSAILANLLKLIDTPRDGALLRYSIGNEYLKAGDTAEAARHLREAVGRDPNHSASWKLLGKTLAESGAIEEALEAYRSGIAV